MAKKKFNNAPKPESPTSKEVDAFVQGGAGHDIYSVDKIETPPEKIKRIGVILSESDHHRFKQACGAMRTTMVAELSAYIAVRTLELENEEKNKNKHTKM